MRRSGLRLEGCEVPDQGSARCPKAAGCGDTASADVPELFPFLNLEAHVTRSMPAFPLITRGGDDGTRTHDPLLANLTAANLGERHGAYGLISGAPGAG